MKKYEYMVVNYRFMGGAGSIEEFINRYAIDGWRFVDWVGDERLVYEREIVEENNNIS